MATKRSGPTDAGWSWWDAPFVIVIGILLLPLAVDLLAIIVRHFSG